MAGELGRLDILVNNAAVAVLGLIDGPAPMTWPSTARSG